MVGVRRLLCLLVTGLGFAGLVLAGLVVPGKLAAHELRPAFLRIVETVDSRVYDVTLKVPARGEYSLPLRVRLPETCLASGEETAVNVAAAVTRRWRVSCVGGLTGQRIVIDGLAATYTDALVQIEHLDGTTQTGRLTPAFAFMDVAAIPSAMETAKAYFALGAEHIALGLDHLLFVFALLLLVDRTRTLVVTITCFTLAHSVTLSIAALGLARVPQPPVEALIALSIVVVAAEIVHKERGSGYADRRAPGIIAFFFGLLHGFGFAGALNAIGLPQKDVPLALFTFNLGVETGQLAFIVLALLAGACLRSLLPVKGRLWRLLAGYGIGSLAGAWFVWRVSAF